MSLQAIPASAVHHIHRILSLVLGIEKMFFTIEDARKHVPLLLKFRQSTELIDQSSISFVSDKIRDGKFSELSCAETASVLRYVYVMCTLF